MSNQEADVWMANVVSKLGEFPKNYMVFDVESTGLDLHNDLVIQLGYALVIDKKLAECSSIMVDWTHSRDEEFCQWLENRMTSTRNNMEAKNPGAGMYKHSVARLKDKGIPAYEAFTHFMDIVKLCKSNKFSFIAHNGLRFDQPMLDRCVKQLRGEDESFKIDTCSGIYFDTMGLERGSQTRIMPNASDDWYTFNHRLVYEGGKIFSSLDRHCSNKYNLVNKHSLEGSAHEADFDCRLTHHLFEEFREMAERGASHT